MAGQQGHGPSFVACGGPSVEHELRISKAHLKWHQDVRCAYRGTHRKANPGQAGPKFPSRCCQLHIPIRQPFGSLPTASARKRYVEQLVAAELAAGVPSEKVVVGGFSQGGAVALLMLRSDVKVAGVVGA
eukprot:360539-Chlamydomonas_euryale.AAC.4